MVHQVFSSQLLLFLSKCKNIKQPGVSLVLHEFICHKSTPSEYLRKISQKFCNFDEINHRMDHQAMLSIMRTKSLAKTVDWI